MQRMHGIDPMFIYSETPATPMEVAYACVLDPSTAPEGYTFERIRAVLESRLPSLLPFRRRMVTVPFGLDHPRWVDDPLFDLDNHLRRIALPDPGGPIEFSAAVAEVMGRPLCPEQPPWEMYVMEGLAHGRVGLVAKVHHAAIDGVAGAALLAQLLDLSPDGPPVTETCAPWTPPALPSQTRLVTDAMPSFLTSPLRSLRAAREVGRTAVRLARHAADRSAGPLSIPLFAPATFDTPVVAEREVAFGVLSLRQIDEIRQCFGVTVNDVVLAVCSGALRTHMARHGEAGPSTDPLVAIVPVSVRAAEGEDENEVGNRLSAMFVSLATDLEHPRHRLEAIAAACADTKSQERRVGFGPVAAAVADAVPPLLARPFIRAGTQLGALRRLRAGNLLVSNVPGPDFPLYFAGLRMEAIHPLGPVVDGVALNVTVQRYESNLFLGINASATAVPDVPALARAMSDELTALVQLATATTAGQRVALDRSRVAAHRAAAAAMSNRTQVRRAVPLAHADPHASPSPARSPRRQLPATPRELSWD